MRSCETEVTAKVRFKFDFSFQRSKMGKDKKAKTVAADNAENDDETTTEVVIKENLAKIAHPLAGKKLTKKILKTVKKGMHECSAYGIHAICLHIRI